MRKSGKRTISHIFQAPKRRIKRKLRLRKNLRTQKSAQKRAQKSAHQKWAQTSAHQKSGQKTGLNTPFVWKMEARKKKKKLRQTCAKPQPQNLCNAPLANAPFLGISDGAGKHEYLFPASLRWKITSTWRCAILGHSGSENQQDTKDPETTKDPKVEGQPPNACFIVFLCKQRGADDL